MNICTYTISTPTKTFTTTSLYEARAISTEHNTPYKLSFVRQKDELHVAPRQAKIRDTYGTVTKDNYHKYLADHTNEDGEIVLDEEA